MKVGVCEMPPELAVGSSAWDALCRSLDSEKPDLFVLNEMPFGEWIAAAPEFDVEVWNRACDAHAEGVRRFEELGCPVVASSRARELDGRRVNEAFLWTASDGASGVHTKQFFPDEECYYKHGGSKQGSVTFASHLQATLESVFYSAPKSCSTSTRATMVAAERS